jgi:hypothetical protein
MSFLPPMYDDNAYPELSGFVARHKRAKPITILIPRRAKLGYARHAYWRKLRMRPCLREGLMCEPKKFS